MNAVGDQAAKGDGSSGPPAAAPPEAGTRRGGVGAVRAAETYYIGSDFGSEDGSEKHWVMAVRARSQVGMIGQVGKVKKRIALKEKVPCVVGLRLGRTPDSK